MPASWSRFGVSFVRLVEQRLRPGDASYVGPPVAETERPHQVVKDGLPVFERLDARALGDQPHLDRALVEQTRPPPTERLAVAEGVARLHRDQRPDRLS